MEPTQHNVTTYPVRFHTDGATTVLPGTRLAVIRWKATTHPTTKVVTPARKAVCVDVPKTVLTIQPAILATALEAAFIDLQDEWLRSEIEAAYEAGREAVFFTASQFELSTLTTYLTTKAASAKLSGETIKAWFTANLRDTLEEKFAAIPDVTDEQVAKAVADYGATFPKLASPAWNPPPKLANQLLEATKQAKPDRVTTQLLTRLTTLLTPKTESLELSL